MKFSDRSNHFAPVQTVRTESIESSQATCWLELSQVMAEPAQHKPKIMQRLIFRLPAKFRKVASLTSYRNEAKHHICGGFAIMCSK
jgi:hypothetical protein